MKTLSETIDAMTAEGLRKHREDRKRLDQMISEGLRQHQRQYSQIEAMTEKALAEINKREGKLEAVRKQMDRPGEAKAGPADHEIKFRAEQQQRQEELSNFSESELMAIYDTAKALHDLHSLMERSDGHSMAVRDFIDKNGGLEITQLFDDASAEVVARLHNFEEEGQKPNRELCLRAADHFIRDNEDGAAAITLRLSL